MSANGLHVNYAQLIAYLYQEPILITADIEDNLPVFHYASVAILLLELVWRLPFSTSGFGQPRID